MSDSPTAATRCWPRPFQAGAFAAALLALGATASWAQTAAQRPSAASGAASAGRDGQRAPLTLAVKTPRELAEQLTTILAKQKTPHQVYANYAHIFQVLAAREAGSAVGNQQADKMRKRLVEHLNGMTSLLNAMAEQTRIRDAIRRGASALPLEQRQPAFAQAGIEHGRLLTEFARMAAALPKGRAQTPPTGP